MFNTLLATKTNVKIGYVPLLDCAPLIVAQEAGFFAEQGVNVQFSRENNWASIRDKLSLGMIDVAHLLAPIVIASQIKQPNNDPNKAFTTSLALGYNGNAITISNGLAKQLDLVEQDLPKALSGLAEFCSQSQRKIVIGTVHPHSMHTYLIHLLLHKAGIHPDAVEIKVLPPVRMVDAMKQQDVDMFCVGEPWNTAAQLERAGKILCYGSELWEFSPEKVLGVNAKFAKDKPESHRKIVKALIKACQWLEEPDHMAQAAIWMATENYLNCSSDLLIQAMINQWHSQSRRHLKRKIFFNHHATAPWPAHAQWIAETMRTLNNYTSSETENPVLSQAYDWQTYAKVLEELELEIPEPSRPPGDIPVF